MTKHKDKYSQTSKTKPNLETLKMSLTMHWIRLDGLNCSAKLHVSKNHKCARVINVLLVHFTPRCKI